MKKSIFIGLCLSVFAVSCSSSSKNEGSKSKNYENMVGYVSDSPVYDAKVEILNEKNERLYICGMKGSLSCDDYTRIDGYFNIRIPKDFYNRDNVTEYTIKSSGGTDKSYGYTIQEDLKLNIDKEIAGNTIYITPITTLSYSIRKSNPQINKVESYNKIRKLFKIEDNVDLSSDPMQNSTLAKLAFILNNISTKIGNNNGYDTLGEIVSSDNSITIDTLIDNCPINQNLKNDTKNLAKYVLGLEGEPKSIIENIKAYKSVLFYDFYSKYINKSNNDSNNILKDNINKIYESIKSIDIPFNELNINQTAKFIAGLDNSLGKNSNIDTTPISESSLSVIYKNINKIKEVSKETSIVIEIPLNQEEMVKLNSEEAIKDYYFSSTKDANYQAMKLIKNIENVALTDNVFMEVSRKYADYGRFDKAIEIANKKISHTHIRLDTIFYIAEKISSNDSNFEKGKEVADKAYTEVKAMYEAKPNLKDNELENMNSLLFRMISTYTVLNDTKTLKEVNDIRNKLIKQITVPEERTRNYRKILERAFCEDTLPRFVRDSKIREGYDILNMMSDILLEKFKGKIPNTSSNQRTYEFNARIKHTACMLKYSGQLKEKYESLDRSERNKLGNINTLLKTQFNSIKKQYDDDMNASKKYAPTDTSYAQYSEEVIYGTSVYYNDDINMVKPYLNDSLKGDISYPWTLRSLLRIRINDETFTVKKSGEVSQSYTSLKDFDKPKSVEEFLESFYPIDRDNFLNVFEPTGSYYTIFMGDYYGVVDKLLSKNNQKAAVDTILYLSGIIDTVGEIETNAFPNVFYDLRVGKVENRHVNSPGYLISLIKKLNEISKTAPDAQNALNYSKAEIKGYIKNIINIGLRYIKRIPHGASISLDKAIGYGSLAYWAKELNLTNFQYSNGITYNYSSWREILDEEFNVQDVGKEYFNSRPNADLYFTKALDLYELVGINENNQTQLQEYLNKNLEYVSNLKRTTNENGERPVELITVLHINVSSLYFRTHNIEMFNKVLGDTLKYVLEETLVTGADRLKSITRVAGKYAEVGMISEGYSVLEKNISKKPDLEAKTIDLSRVIINHRTSFVPNSFIDSDSDNIPDFYIVSNLPTNQAYDDDVDGDGIKNHLDEYPYVSNKLNSKQ